MMRGHAADGEAPPTTLRPRLGDSNAVSAKAPPLSTKLSDEELAEVAKLAKAADSVELKLMVPMSAHRATIKGLQLDPVEARSLDRCSSSIPPSWP
jgi:hypothetical protein